MKLMCVIPTRGDVDMDPLYKHLRNFFAGSQIWWGEQESVYGRYEMINSLPDSVDLIYTQDDDCLTDVRPIQDAYEPGKIIHAMTPEHSAQYPGRVQLVGFGAIFDRELVGVLDGWKKDDVFLRECDRVFTALNECVAVYPEIRHLPHGTADNRLYRQPEHGAMRREIERRIAVR